MSNDNLYKFCSNFQGLTVIKRENASFFAKSFQHFRHSVNKIPEYCVKSELFLYIRLVKSKKSEDIVTNFLCVKQYLQITV